MNKLPAAHAALLETLQRHMTAEMKGDMETAMATVADEPYVNHVPVMTGGVGRDGVRQFYGNHRRQILPARCRDDLRVAHRRREPARRGGSRQVHAHDPCRLDASRGPADWQTSQGRRMKDRP